MAFPWGGLALIVSTSIPLMTTEELLALPEEWVDRELIQGRLREKALTNRNRWHSRIEARIAQLLLNWLDQQPEPRGEILSGEAGCRLRRNPDSTVGIDVAYISADLAAQEPKDTSLIEGTPILAVEILSPSDKQEEIDEKIDEYLAAGVAVVWVVNPHFQTTCVYRPGQPPELFNIQQDLSGEPQLPGFRVKVADIFRKW
jgi:Uma2 family endonuclease